MRTPRRAAALFGALVAASVLGRSETLAQQHRLPLPPPPVRQAVLCMIPFDVVLASGLDGEGAVEDRAAAVDLVVSLYRSELDRSIRQVEAELGPLAFAVFVPGERSLGETRLEELLANGCVHQALARGRRSDDLDRRARSREIWNLFHSPTLLPEQLLAPVEPDRAPAQSAPATAPSTRASLAIELPPSDLVVPGELLTGRVTWDAVEPPAAPDRAAKRLVAPGLVVEGAGQTVRVGGDGLFVLRAPTEPGTYMVEVRGEHRAFEPPVEEALTIAAGGSRAVEPADGRAARPAVDCLGFDAFLDATIAAAPVAPPSDCPVMVPRVLLPDQRLIVLGRLHGGSGLATRAFVGPWEAPLLAKTPIAAIFDVSGVPAGPHALTVLEGSVLVAAAAIDRVTLESSSDRSDLGRGETATFTVRVAGLPMSAPAPASPARDPAPAVAFLDYANHTPEVGRFPGRADRFSVEIAAGDLEVGPAPARGEPHPELIERLTLAVGSFLAGPPGSEGRAGWKAQQETMRARRPTPEPPATATSASGTFGNVQRYRGTGAGDFHVGVTVRLPELERHVPAIVHRPSGPRDQEAGERPSAALASAGSGGGRARTATGIDRHGSWVEIDQQRFYFTTAYVDPRAAAAPTANVVPPLRLHQASCAGTCQCQIQSWEHAEELAAQVKALDQSQPGWRTLDAEARGCVCQEARSQCFSLLSNGCRERCKRYFESALTERVSGFAVDASVAPCADAGACER